MRSFKSRLQPIYLLLTLAVTGLSSATYAQEINLTEEVHSLLPSPDVAQMNKYVEVPVSLYTGQMNLSVPIYTIEMNHFQVPIALQYSSSGIKVDEPASWIGAGWTLTGEGAVSRNVNGLPDENNTMAKGMFYNTHYYDTNGIRVSDLSICGDDFLESPEFDPESVPDSIAMGFLDFEPDVFYLSSPLGNLKFVFDHNRQIVPYEYTDITIVEHPFQNLGSVGTRWVIRNPDGTLMEFEALELLNSNSGCTSNGIHYPTAPRNVLGVRSAWKITKISRDREWIKFSYANDSVAVQSLYSETTQYGVAGAQTKFKTCLSETKYFTKHLTGITTSSGINIDFYSSSRNDLDGKKKLDSVQVTRKGSFERKMVLNNDDSQAKLRLMSVYQVGENGEQLPGHTFEYHPGLLPQIGSRSQDYWGYNNGQNNTTLIPDFKSGPYHFTSTANRDPNLSAAQTGTIRSVTYPTGGKSVFTYGLNDYYDDSHDCVELYAVQTPPGEIDTINFTINAALNMTWTNANYVDTDFDGGGTQYSIMEIQKLDNGTYQRYVPTTTSGNRYLIQAGDYRIYAENHEVGEDLSMSVEFEQPCAQIVTVGGLRIERVEFQEGGTTVLTKEYEYKDAQGTSSGLLFNKPLFGGHQTTYQEGSIGGISGLTCTQGAVSVWMNVSSSPTIATFGGTHIAYSSVREKMVGSSDNGSILHEFTNEEFPGYNYPPVDYVDVGITNGKQKARTVYNAAQDTLELVSSAWEEVNSSTVAYGMKAVKVHNRFCYECTGNDLGNDFLTSFYQIRPKWYRLKETLTFTYEGPDSLQRKERYEYGSNHLYPVSTKVSTSKADTLETEIIRDATHPALVTESLKYRQLPGNPVKTAHQKWTYNQGLAVGSSVWDRQSDTFYKSDTIVRDTLGNILSHHKFPNDDGIQTLYLWSHEGARVVAQIQNSTTAEVEAAWGSYTIADLYNETSASTISTRLASLRNALQVTKAQMQTIEYGSGLAFGPSKIIDPNGIETSYEYDSFGRLVLIRDHDNKVIKKYSYIYANQ